MPNYRFVIRGGGQRAAVEVETLELPDDDSAWEVAENLIRGLLKEELGEHDGRIMEITESARVVATIAFDLKGLRDKRTLQ